MAMAALIISAAGSLASFAAKKSQADIERGESEVAADQVELGVKQREADRKDRLASSLSIQNAQAAAGGIASFEGSPLTILHDSIEREKTATQRDVFSSEMTALATRSRGKVRHKISNLGARASLLQQGASLANTGRA